MWNDLVDFLAAPAPTWLVVALVIGLGLENKRLGRAIDAVFWRLPPRS